MIEERAPAVDDPPILRGKDPAAPSVFTPESLLREARRQKRLAPGEVPDVCILDPDGDMVRHLLAAGRARKHPGWACYHTDLWAFDVGGREAGVIGCAVGAAFVSRKGASVVQLAPTCAALPAAASASFPSRTRSGSASL